MKGQYNSCMLASYAPCTLSTTEKPTQKATTRVQLFVRLLVWMPNEEEIVDITTLVWRCVLWHFRVRDKDRKLFFPGYENRNVWV